MADCIDRKSGFQKIVSYLPVATMITIIAVAVTFGIAWGQIREEVTTNKETIRAEQIERIEIAKQLSSISTDIKWLIDAEKESRGE